MIYICKSLNYLKDIKEGDFKTILDKTNMVGYDYLYVYREAFCDEDKEDFFHTMIEVCAYSEIPVIVEFPITHFEDMKKLHYANVKLIIASDKTNVGEEIIEEGRTRFGKKLIVDKKIFEAESRKVNSEKQFDMIEASDIAGDTYYLIDNGEEVLNVHKIKNDLSNKGLETKALKPTIAWDELKKNSDGLVPVIVTDYRDGSVLMMAYMNEEAYNNTFVTGLMNYYSRSRQTQWVKGETSGHYQYVKYIKADCDKDTLLAGVSQIGVACHTGSPTCFFNDVIKADYTEKNPAKIFDNLYKVIEDRKENPKEGSYTNYLFDKGLDKILKKVGEEAVEIVIASKNEEAKEIKYEIADFLYHLSVLMVEKGVTWNEVCDELANR